MSWRVVDLRIHQAQKHGIIVGLPPNLSERIADIANSLEDALEWSDVLLSFEPYLTPIAARIWRVAVSGDLYVEFTWHRSRGAYNIHL